jgi:hypothetical protein
VCSELVISRGTTNPQPAAVAAAPIETSPLKDNEFRVSELPSGSALLVGEVAVFNVG